MWYDKALSYELKRAFVMSYMRSLEGALHSGSDPEQGVSFWEFLDIEFDPQNRAFRFVAYYTVQPSFPNLFNRLVGSPALRRIEDEVQEKEENRIHKQDWKSRSELEYELGLQMSSTCCTTVRRSSSTWVKRKIWSSDCCSRTLQSLDGTTSDMTFFHKRLQRTE